MYVRKVNSIRLFGWAVGNARIQTTCIWKSIILAHYYTVSLNPYVTARSLMGLTVCAMIRILRNSTFVIYPLAVILP